MKDNALQAAIPSKISAPGTKLARTKNLEKKEAKSSTETKSDSFTKQINSKFDYVSRMNNAGKFFDEKIAEKSNAIARQSGVVEKAETETIKVNYNSLRKSEEKADLPSFVTDTRAFERYKKEYDAGKMKIEKSANGLDYEFSLNTAHGSVSGVFKRPVEA